MDSCHDRCRSPRDFRKNYVRYLLGYLIHPLLPKIPVGLVKDANVATTRTTLVWLFTGWESCVKIIGICVVVRKPAELPL